ncbi:agmatine deiminase [Longimycelium tulufanense]|uniref:Agmatine deiminase n=1 Tax=Longimycelium tulufanense TaxID=907463 RepID=A0A8J3CI51_9PSEU|nr:agmatine deiminase family protein [Longimycelium tulufanense]GGM70464.1 agmatine deiminase [Longimycelium tulufanense]
MPARVPAEWEPHGGCVMVWPWARRVWGRRLRDVQWEFASIARTIARFEPVLVLAHPGTSTRARRSCGPAVRIVEVESDDMWARDTCPVFAVDECGAVLGLEPGFNGWGRKAPMWRRDAALAGELCAHLGIQAKILGPVVEGGAVITDGQGTLILSEECLLNPNRNPGMRKDELASLVAGEYGASTVIWLPYGLSDDETDGHVDGVAAFLAPARVLAQTAWGSGTPDEQRLAHNLEVLRTSTDAMGRRLEVVEIPYCSEIFLGADPVTVSYVNFYLPMGAVIVPTAGTGEDAPALALLGELFPDREVIGVPARAIAWGGGGVHCMTQPVPAGLSTTQWSSLLQPTEFQRR